MTSGRMRDGGASPDYYAYFHDYYDYGQFDNDADEEARHHDGGGATRFCGDPLWIANKFGDNVTRYIWEPSPFTWCFRHAVLAQIPVLFFFFAYPLFWLRLRSVRRYRRWLRRSGQRHEPDESALELPYDWRASSKHGLAVILCLDKLALLLRSVDEWLVLGENVPIIEFLYPFSNIVTLVCLIYTMEKCRRNGVISPGITFCTFFLFVVCGIPEFHAWIVLGMDPQTVNDVDFIRYLSYLVWFPVCCAELFLHLLDEHPQRRADAAAKQTLNNNEMDAPEPRASFLGRQLFSWFSPLIARANARETVVEGEDGDERRKRSRKRPLTTADVWPLPVELRARTTYAAWAAEWTPRVGEYERRKRRRSAKSASFDHRRFLHYDKHDDAVQVGDVLVKSDAFAVDDRTPLLTSADGTQSFNNGALNGHRYGSDGSNNNSCCETSQRRAEKPVVLPSIIRTLFSIFGADVVAAAVYKLISDLLQFANPLLLRELILFVESSPSDASDDGGRFSTSVWYGYALALTLFVVGELSSFFMNNYFNTMNGVGIGVQSALTSAVYVKTLRLSMVERRNRSVGEIVNLMAVDVDRFQIITTQIQQFWSSPLQIIIAFYLLHSTVGWSMLAGVAFMAVLMLCNFCCAVFIKRWQICQMALMDARLKLTAEVLAGIRVVKAYAAEAPLMREIVDYRRREIGFMRGAAFLRVLLETLNFGASFLVAFFTFGVFTLSSAENRLTPEIVFVSLTLFSRLQFPMFFLAELTAQSVQRFLVTAVEVDDTIVERDFDARYERAVDVQFASFDWPPIPPSTARKVDGGRPHTRRSYTHSNTQLSAQRPYTLNDVELHVRRGALVTVVGRVGAGKSSLLAAIIGEMPKLYGYVGLRGRVAYCAQRAFIMNRTLKENILFKVDDGDASTECDEEHYRRCVAACALKADFCALPHGDRTPVGEHGVRLSGGQRARVALARALYARADVLLLDDPLAAVDAVVARQLFRAAIGPQSLSAGTTRLLVSNATQFMHESDLIVVVDESRIRAIGTYEEIMAEEGTARLVFDCAKQQQERSREPDELRSGGNANREDDDAAENIVRDDSENPLPSVEIPVVEGPFAVAEVLPAVVADTPSTVGVKSFSSSEDKPSSSSSSSRRTTTTAAAEEMPDERADCGRVRTSVYATLFRAMRWRFCVLFVVFSALNAVASTLDGFWLSAWSDDAAFDAAPTLAAPIFPYRFGVYTALGLFAMLFMAVANVGQVIGAFNASARLYFPLLGHVVHSPVAFFDTTPIGRVLNRFGKDFETIDNRLSASFRMLSLSVFRLLQIFATLFIANFLFVFGGIPIVALYALILRFIPVSRQLQRLVSVTRTPLYNTFAETVDGVMTIRAYALSAPFFRAFTAKVDKHLACKFYSLAGNRWLSIRLEVLGNVTVLVAAALAVSSKAFWSADDERADPGLTGLSVSTSMKATMIFAMLVRTLSELESNMVAVERVKEYSELPQEVSAVDEDGQPAHSSMMVPHEWPARGWIVLDRVTVRYRPDRAPCLDAVSAEIRAGEKLAVVGRTGAGKSSLVMCLLRLIDIESGSIRIDDVDTRRVDLSTLRSRIGVVVQDPTLFTGTIRFNVDLFGAHTDAEVWTAIEQAGLRDLVSAHAEGLDWRISDGGENLSVGQRQLICLARALLRHARVVILDEATASVDALTDALIQATIRRQFADSTVITVAHRIATVVDYDRIMVMDGGRVVELDTPARLLANPSSVFHALYHRKPHGGGDH